MPMRNQPQENAGLTRRAEKAGQHPWTAGAAVKQGLFQQSAACWPNALQAASRLGLVQCLLVKAFVGVQRLLCIELGDLRVAHVSSVVHFIRGECKNF